MNYFQNNWNAIALGILVLVSAQNIPWNTFTVLQVYFGDIMIDAIRYASSNIRLNNGQYEPTGRQNDGMRGKYIQMVVVLVNMMTMKPEKKKNNNNNNNNDKMMMMMVMTTTSTSTVLAGGRDKITAILKKTFSYAFTSTKKHESWL